MFCETNWEYVSLSDPETVKALLMFRSELDPTYGVEDRKLLESGTDLANVNNNIHLTYIDLQRVMDKVNFTDRQKYYIELICKGMSEDDIKKHLDICDADVVINNICNEIANKNKEMWSSWAKWDYVKVNTDYKKCSKCEEFKPMTYKYFRSRQGTKDGLMYLCRNCE